MTRIWVIDTETTGLDPQRDRCVELAAVEIIGFAVDGVAPLSGQWRIGAATSSFVNPRIPIPSEASGVHHIVDIDVENAPDLGEAIERVLGSFWRDSDEVIAGHNCRFDRDFLPPLREKRWLDTYRAALHVWPDAPNFKNGTLFYWRGEKRLEDGNAHRALFDAHMTARVLIHLLAERSLDELLRLSTKAAILRTVGFGKHFGKLWTETPDDYLQWAARQNFDPDVKHTIRHELKRRSEAA